jgi:hypothetical protein
LNKGRVELPWVLSRTFRPVIMPRAVPVHVFMGKQSDGSVPEQTVLFRIGIFPRDIIPYPRGKGK